MTSELVTTPTLISTVSPTVSEDAPSPTMLMETNMRSQLPPTITGVNSSHMNQSEDKKWANFWSDKQKRKVYHKASDCLNKVKKSESKIWFLSKCLKLDVIPKTLKTNTSHGSSFAQNSCEDWNKIMKDTGRSLTKVALKDEILHLSVLKTAMCQAESNLFKEAEDDICLVRILLEKLEERGKQLTKQVNNTHRQKLRNLLLLNGAEVPPDLCTSGLSSINISQLSEISDNSKKARKFTKRSKRKKQNQKQNRKRLNLVTNYSKTTLSEEEESVLNKGLNFCPMRKKVNRTDIEVSYQRYARSCRWREFWFSQDEGEDFVEEETPNINIFRSKEIKTNFPRNHPCPQRLQDHLTAVHSGMIGAKLNNHQSNLTPGEWKAIDSLKLRQKNQEIIIKPNDKTGGCSVLDYTAYVQAMELKLAETFVDSIGNQKAKYEKVTVQDLETSLSRVKDIVMEGLVCGFMTDSDAAVMVPEKPKPGRLYGLVKDHKPVNPVSGIPPLREVISGSGSNTEYISAFVDHHLKQEVKKLPSFIEDTPHLLRDIMESNSKGRLPPNAFPVSMDIVALYPSIPWKEGIEALEKASERREDRSVPTDYLMRLMLLVLCSNIFEFDGHLWLQKSGTAIGTRAAPTLANIFMGEWEADLLNRWSGTPVQFYRRYIDDLFFIWSGTVDELEDFVSLANSLCKSIKVTVEYNKDTKAVNYLDMKIFIDGDGYIRTDLYRKENTKNSYLLPSSCHPGHVTKNIPFSLGYRLLRICWCEELLDERLAELAEVLEERGYRRRSIVDAFKRVKEIPRTKALERVHRDREVGDRVRFIVKYDPRLPDIPEILHSSWRFLVEDKRMQEVFPKPPIVCYQRVESLRDMLVKARLPAKISRVGRSMNMDIGFKPCRKANCPVCDQLKVKGKAIKSVCISSTQEEFQIKSKLTCSSSNVVYCITCRRGGRLCPAHPQYIGETGKEAKERFRGHRGTITQPSQANTTAPVGVHFRSNGHSLCDLEFIPIEKVHGDNMTRKVREHFLINKFDSVNKGLNIKN